MTRAVFVVLPGDIDDPATPSGGNRYDRRVCDGLLKIGDVHEIAVRGRWPYPDGPARAALSRALGRLPDGAAVLLDGLVACPVPEVLEPEAQRLRLTVLVHLPLGDETGLDPAAAAALRAAEKRTLHAATAVIATSTGAARRLIDLHDLEKVDVAVPGVDPAPPATGSRGGGRLLCVAAVTPRKGQDLLVDALDGCADLAWSCDFVGAFDRSPDYADQVRARAGRNIRFVGSRVGAELDDSYAGADLLVLPSRAETYGMVVTEALAHGLPVLATQVDGVPEALGAAADGSLPGLLVPPDDVAALTAALRGWLTEPDRRAKWRAAARSRRDSLPSWDETIRDVSEVLSR